MFTEIVLSILLGLVILILGGKFVYRSSHGQCVSDARLDGKVVLLTGGSAGIGKETARDLAKRGAKLILGCRNPDKGHRVAAEIMSSTGNTNIEVRTLDTSDLSSVRKFAKSILESEDKLHILINNAGIVGNSASKRVLTAEGHELTMVTNHLGHFLLTNMLGGLLKAGAPSRVVNVSSGAHLYVKDMDPADLTYAKGNYRSMTAYGRSKLCNILLTKVLAKRLRGDGVTAYALHPGVVSTEIFDKVGGWFSYFAGLLARVMAKDAVAGAQTSIHCAVAEAVTAHSGAYFSDCEVATASPLAEDEALAEAVWASSASAVKLTAEEALFEADPDKPYY